MNYYSVGLELQLEQAIISDILNNGLVLPFLNILNYLLDGCNHLIQIVKDITMNLIEDRRFYVYGYFDPRNNQPFYIGKGQGKRLIVHLREANNKKSKDHPKIAKIKKLWKQNLEPIIKKLFKNLTENEAFQKEINLIKNYELIENDGYLTNLDYGGSGVSHTKQTKDKISKKSKGKKRSQEFKDKVGLSVKKRWSNPDYKNAISEKMKNRIFTESHKKKLSESGKGRIGSNLGKKFTKKHKEKIGKGNSKKVGKYSLDDILIKIYDSITEACLDINTTSLSWAIKNNKPCGGFLWKKI